MCGLLGTNTSLIKVTLKSYHSTHQQSNTMTGKIKLNSTGNCLKNKEATTLSEALKINKTITKLNLTGKHKRHQTQKISINRSFFFVCITQTTSLEKKEQLR